MLQVLLFVQELHFSSNLFLLALWQVLCGIAEGGGHVHLVMVYQSVFGEASYEDKLSVSYRLPVREDD